MLIDFHTHIFPEKIAARTVDVLKNNIVVRQGYLVENHTDATLPDLERSMSEQQVDYSVVLPIATKPSQTPTINRYAKEVTKENIISFGSLHPLQEDAPEVLKQLKEDGFVGIKLHPEYQGVYFDGPETIKILQKAEELGLYVLLHAGEDIGIEPPIHATPERIRHTLDYVSGKYIIAAHMGGWGMWDDVEKYLVGTEIFMDTAYVKDYLGKEQCKRIIEHHGADKILFGSDSPWEEPSATLAYLESLELTEEDLQKIKYKNACKILSL